MVGDRVDNDVAPAKKLGMKNRMRKTGYSQVKHT